MKSLIKIILPAVAFLFSSQYIHAQKKNAVQYWLTNSDKSVLFELQKQQVLKFAKAENQNPTIYC